MQGCRRTLCQPPRAPSERLTDPCERTITTAVTWPVYVMTFRSVSYGVIPPTSPVSNAVERGRPPRYSESVCRSQRTRISWAYTADKHVYYFRCNGVLEADVHM